MKPAERLRVRVSGLDCADEVAALRKAVGPLVGAENLRFDVVRGRMEVLGAADSDAVVAAVYATVLVNTVVIALRFEGGADEARDRGLAVTDPDGAETSISVSYGGEGFRLNRL